MGEREVAELREGVLEEEEAAEDVPVVLGERDTTRESDAREETDDLASSKSDARTKTGEVT